MDTGPGVAPELAGTIFDRHRRGQTGAPRISGLGLALVREIMQLHGGGIRLATQPGWGAVFIASLPAC